MGVQSRLKAFCGSFSFIGLAVGTLFFALSLSPSLLPRNFVVQGVLSGFALAAGYGLGVLLVAFWKYLELPPPGTQLDRWSKRVTTVSVAAVTVVFLWRATVWQNSIRSLMEMEPVPTAYPARVAGIALLTAIVWLVVARGISLFWSWIHRRMQRVMPRRVSYAVSTTLVVITLLLVGNNVFARLALNAADSVFLELDSHIDDNIAQPASPFVCGSSESLVAWDAIGRRGREFIAAGPTRESISEFWGRDANQPVRVYVGLAARETVKERAQLALDELIRVGGFDRSLLIIATPTGTGWLDPGGVDTVEYLHGGDTAIVSMQYSYLPSWITILVDPNRSQNSAHALFDAVYNYWTTLPKTTRPRLYLHGLSLGALGSAASADLFTVFEDPIQGGVWSGPPFPSVPWARATSYRNSGSPMWLPTFRDGSMLRFTGRECALDQWGTRWGPMRFVYIQHASDPMTFFSPDLAYRKPDWLSDGRGPDVSPYLSWYPIVTFLQTAFDLPMATSVPFGYGHNFLPASYIDAWAEVSQPPDWSPEQTEQLKNYFTAN
ncbi:MAG: alpha/beta-hydrolase family protein [Planctomycetaceae bacterium]|nr:alpha/beta-hydrolase family protein [Planctomycetaceae bacterium]